MKRSELVRKLIANGVPTAEIVKKTKYGKAYIYTLRSALKKKAQEKQDTAIDPRIAKIIKDRGEPTGNILDEAYNKVYGDREKDYGPPTANMLMAAKLWRAYLKDETISPDDVVLMMALFKIARLAHDSSHRDSMVDLAGYAALLERVQG